MPRRYRDLTWAACYLAALVMLAWSGYSFANHLSPAAEWTSAVSGVLLVLLGGELQFKGRSIAAQFQEERQEIDILQTELRQQTMAIDSFADGLDIAILICDFQGAVIYANNRFREMFQFESPLGRSVLATTMSYDLEQLVLDTVQTGKENEKEVTFPPPDERVAIAKAWVHQEQQRVFLSVFEVTNLRMLERIRRDFVANVSHELRTPMSIIRAYAETLLDDPLDTETAKKYLPGIIEEIDRLSRLTQDLLVLSASESNRVQKQECDVAEIFAETVSQLAKKAEDKGLVLEYHGPEHLPIEANAAQMSQVALNLIDNAINYTTNGRVNVTVNLVDQTRVEIKVKDTGIGIASEHANRIFERFYRVDKGRSRSSGGTGLGLSIVKHIVEAHDGTVGLKSALNEGSEFMVTLPVGRPSK